MKLVAGGLFFLPLCAADYATYIGDNYSYNVAALATDAGGNTYVTGSRAVAGSSDVFLTRLDAAGNIVFTRALGGKGTDTASAIALDPSGIYVAGSTTSLDFPLSGALQATPNLGGSGFIVKFSPDGGTILYSTYFGGTLGRSSIAAIATDSNGNLYVTGSSYASDFPVTPGLPDGRGTVANPQYQGAFVAEISAAGDRVLYGTLIVGTTFPADAAACRVEPSTPRLTAGVGIAVDGAGNAYVAGNATTVDLPTTSGALLKQGVGAFVVKIRAGGAGLAYLTYLDAADNCSFPEDILAAIAVDPAGNAYLAGAASDPNFPVTAGAAQPVFGGPAMFGGPYGDAFVAKLKPDGSALAWSTFVGGAAGDAATSIALDAAGSVWASGTTASANFPNANGWSGGTEFLVGVNAAGSALIYAARYPKGAVAQAIAADPAPGLVHAAGASGIVAAIATTALPSPRIFGAISMAGSALLPGFAVGNGAPLSGRIAPGELISIYGPHIGPSSPLTGTFDSAGFLPTTLGGVTVTIGGKAAPLLYVSDSQINAVAPMGLTEGAANISITAVPAAFRVVVAAAEPSIFLNPDGSAAALNQDGSVNSAANPAVAGSVVTIWVTGTGVSFPRLMDGQLASGASYSCFLCQVQSGSSPLRVAYAGSAPGLVAGVTQINFVMPAGPGSVPFPFTLSVGGATATAYVWVPGFVFGGIL